MAKAVKTTTDKIGTKKTAIKKTAATTTGEKISPKKRREATKTVKVLDAQPEAAAAPKPKAPAKRTPPKREKATPKKTVQPQQTDENGIIVTVKKKIATAARTLAKKIRS